MVVFSFLFFFDRKYPFRSKKKLIKAAFLAFIMKTHMGVKTLLKCMHICPTFTPGLVSQYKLCLLTFVPGTAIHFLF